MNWFPLAFSHLGLLVVAALLFHAILWSFNGRYLWSQRRVILMVVVIAEVWMAVTDPLGGHMGAWYFDPAKVLGVWFLGVMPLEDFFGAAVISSAAACAVLVFGYGPKRWVW
jgi:lycopene cyclase domain-containing protein